MIITTPLESKLTQLELFPQKETEKLPFIIGVSGNKRHGKDTVASILAKRYGYSRAAFATKLKEGAKLMLGFSDEQVYGDLKEVVDERYGVTPRHALQTLGTEWGRNYINTDVWIIATLSNLETKTVISDCRFLNEAEAIRKADGIVIKVIRPSKADIEDTHPSEKEIALIEADIVLINDGSIEDLEKQLLSAIKQWRSNVL